MYITKKFGSCFGLWVQRYNNILNKRICFKKKTVEISECVDISAVFGFCTFRGLFEDKAALPSTSCRDRSAASRWG